MAEVGNGMETIKITVNAFNLYIHQNAFNWLWEYRSALVIDREVILSRDDMLYYYLNEPDECIKFNDSNIAVLFKIMFNELCTNVPVSINGL